MSIAIPYITIEISFLIIVIMRPINVMPVRDQSISVMLRWSFFK